MYSPRTTTSTLSFRGGGGTIPFQTIFFFHAFPGVQELPIAPRVPNFNLFIPIPEAETFLLTLPNSN